MSSMTRGRPRFSLHLKADLPIAESITLARKAEAAGMLGTTTRVRG